MIKYCQAHPLPNPWKIRFLRNCPNLVSFKRSFKRKLMFGGRFTIWEILVFDGGGTQERSGEFLGPSELPLFPCKINLCGLQALIFSLNSCCQKLNCQERENQENQNYGNKVFLRALVQNLMFLAIQINFLTNKSNISQYLKYYCFFQGGASSGQGFKAKNTKIHLPFLSQI